MSRRRDPAGPDDLGRQLEQLRRRVEQLRQERDQTQQERDRIREQRDRLEQERTDLERQRDRLEQERDRLQQRVRRLEEDLEASRRAGCRQAAPFRRQAGRKIGKDQQQRPGRRRGHPGSYRPLPETIDERVEVPLPHCPHCRGPVDEVHSRVQYIEEIPRLRPRVSQVITYQGVCRHCGPVETRHPLQTSRARGAAGVQLGPRALAWAVELNKGQGLSMRKTCRILDGLAGLHLSAGGLSQALDRVADRLSPGYRQLRTELQASPAVFVDETSWWVGEPGWWLWVFTTPETTLYAVEPSRGSAVVEQTLGDEFSGTLVSDCLAAYDPPSYAKHKCIAHHLKAIAEARAGPDAPADRSYLDQWILFFQTVTALYERFREAPERDRDRLAQVERWRDRLLREVPAGPAGLTIRKRLEKQRPHLLGCLANPAAEPTNNRAERALRPAVIARKISCGNKTVRGKRTWETLVSLAVSWKQQDLDVVDTLARKLSLAR